VTKRSNPAARATELPPRLWDTGEEGKTPSFLSEKKAKGSLFLIGGAEDKSGECTVLRRFVELCGGASASIGVCATASTRAQQAADFYVDLFRRLGVQDVFAMPITSRQDAFNPKYIRCMSELSGIFFTGGNQLTLTSAIGGTGLSQALHDMYMRGGVVGGTSAGASAVSRHMVMAGKTGVSPRKNMVSIAAGLGLLKNVIVDQHFSARRRIGRLLTVVAHNPFLLGVGIDEDTAAHFDSQQIMRVVGRGTVTVLDGSEMTYSNVSQVESSTVPLCIYNVRTHVLIDGSTYDVPKRTPVDIPPLA
jgi:cyanophycinase